MNLKILFTGAALIFLSSCITLKPLEFKTVTDFSITKISEKPEIKFYVTGKNPNRFGCTIVYLETEVMNDDKVTLNIKTEKNIRVKANEPFSIPVNLQADVNTFSKFANAGIDALFGGKPITANIKGTVTVRKFIFRRKFPFEFKEKIDNKILKNIF